jgi:release factor glutamine methyltransferase
VVERCLALLEEVEAPRIADVGTGTGAIALALKQERPDAVVVATDISADALELARENAAANELEIELVEGDLLAGIAGPLDLIVSNPPYVGADELDALEPEVREWEPRDALVDEGQTVRLARAAQSVLDGWLVVEVHEERAQALSDDLARLGYRTISVGLDLAGKERMVEAQWGAERPSGS